MAPPDPAVLAAGQNIGQNAATPLDTYLRRQDLAAGDWLGVVEVTPFGAVRAAGKVKKVSVIPGQSTGADATTTIYIGLERGGSPVALWSGSLGAWTALAETDLATPGTPTQKGDIFIAVVNKGSSGIIPALLFIVEQDIGL